MVNDASTPPISWTVEDVGPEDILDGARTLKISDSHTLYLTRPPYEWTAGETYLRWADEALKLGNAFGWDAAICYGKRAVCREIDWLMVCNHLGHLNEKKSYPEKLDMLTDIGIKIGKNVVHSLVIDVRNGIEHSYTQSSELQAIRALELVHMFFDSTMVERERQAIIALGARFNMRSDTGREGDLYIHSLSSDAGPMLLIDVCGGNDAALLIFPKEMLVQRCRVRDFGPQQGIALARMLRQHYEVQRRTGSASTQIFGSLRLGKLYRDLGLGYALFPV